MSRYAKVCCCMTLLLVSSDAFAARLQPVLSGLSSPVLVTHAGDGSGRLFVVEQPGVIKVLAAGGRSADGLPRHPAIVCWTAANAGCSASPSIRSTRINGRFFVNYTREADGATVIAEYQRSANPNRGAREPRRCFWSSHSRLPTTTAA